MKTIAVVHLFFHQPFHTLGIPNVKRIAHRDSCLMSRGDFADSAPKGTRCNCDFAERVLAHFKDEGGK